MLDIVGDENQDLVRRQRMMRWDKSKRKYIQTTVGEEISSSSNKKIKTESGQYIKSSKVKIGEIYEKWQKKTQKSVGGNGMLDDDDDEEEGGDGNNTQGHGRQHKKPRSNHKNNPIQKMQQEAAKQNKDLHKNPNADTGIKSAAQIRKDREAVQDRKTKNMSKSGRRQYESRQRGKAPADLSDGDKKKRGYQGKKGFSGNWTKSKPKSK